MSVTFTELVPIEVVTVVVVMVLVLVLVAVQRWATGMTTAEIIPQRRKR